ncbi:uncharacterized protein PHALS_00178 [Plasmopara halstedii]|uniref:Uncharacterized protein n=1 Tax=Plasmopara halstedii TaxID=4781 RepID=A0A0P1A5M2_PLAHL|nr:uncharacterized protein PHALS_00178 [Plasmopara halstedii]CEG35849.1 hypothetical protein PHALS_00178 [Plasmopara halstedii]|eukprot:XP_024572218.1 hypothetical protein PHALS_00178 [Plasmopara halstedii]
MHSIDPDPQCSAEHSSEKSTEFQVHKNEKMSSVLGSNSGQMTIQSDNEVEINDHDVNKILTELFAEVESKKKLLDSEEETFHREQDRLNSLQHEHAELLCILKRSQRRRKERFRVQSMLRRPEEEAKNRKYESDTASNGGSDNGCKDHHRHSNCDRHHNFYNGIKKDRKRLRRFQNDVSLRFRLLRSECQRSELQVEKLMADLRREYADSCLFGTPLKF